MLRPRPLLALLLLALIVALLLAPAAAHKHDDHDHKHDDKHESESQSKDHADSRHALQKDLSRAEDKIDELKHEEHKESKALDEADSKIKHLKQDRDELERKLEKQEAEIAHEEKKLDKQAEHLHDKKKDVKEREADLKHDEHKLEDLKDSLHDRKKKLEHRADKLHSLKSDLKSEAKELKHREKEVKADENDVAKRQKKLDKEEQARENYYYKKYAAPYEHYWRNENRTDELSHHVDHGRKHHEHHGTKHHVDESRYRGHGEQPELPAPEYEKYYKQYLPVGVAQQDRHHPASSSASVDAESIPSPVPAESLSESSSYSKYMDPSDSYSAGPEIDASSQMSSKFYEPYESMFDKYMPDGVPVKASATERPLPERPSRYGRRTENLPPYPEHPRPHEAPEWTDPKLSPEEQHAEYARSREVERQHERMKHQRKHHGRSHLHRSSDPEASERSYRKHGGHEFEYSGKHGHHSHDESAAPGAAAPSSPQSGFGGDYSQYYKQYVGGNNLVERGSEDEGELDMEKESNESHAYRHDESDTKSHVTHEEDVKMQLPPQSQQSQQPQEQQQSQPQPPSQPPTQPSQTQPAHPTNATIQSPFTPRTLPPQTNITSSTNTTIVSRGDPADRHGDESDVVASQVLVEKHHHHKHDKHAKEHEHETKHEHKHKHKHKRKGGQQPEQPEQREQREQPEQPQQDWHSGDRGDYGGEQPEQSEQEQQRWWRPPSESASLVESAAAPEPAAAVASPASLEAMLPMDNSESFGTVTVISLGVMFVMLAGVMMFGGGRSRWAFKSAFGGSYPPATEPLLPTTTREVPLDPRQEQVITTGTGRAYQSV